MVDVVKLEGLCENTKEREREIKLDEKRMVGGANEKKGKAWYRLI